MPYSPVESRGTVLVYVYEEDPDVEVWGDEEEGTLWYNQTDSIFKMWDGALVRPISLSITTVSADPPSGGRDGDVWIQYYTL